MHNMCLSQDDCLFSSKKYRYTNFLAAAFGGNLVLGWTIGKLLGGISETAQIFITVSFFGVFVFGYLLWIARLQAIAYQGIGRGLIWALIQMLIRRKKVENLSDILPDQNKLKQMAVRAQKAASSFKIVSIPIAVCTGLMATLLTTERTLLTIEILLIGSIVGWGILLSTLAHRGYLPILEQQ